MKIKVPYLVARPGAAGATRYFWQPASRLRDLGWKTERLVKPDGTPAATLDEAIELAKAKNEQLAAWRRGERTGGEPELPAPVPEVRPGTVAHAIRLYKASPRYLKNAAKTQADYAKCLAKIEAWAGNAPVKAITRELVQDYYEALMKTGRHAQANATIRVLRILLKYSWDKGLTSHNAAEKPGLIGTAPRLRIWSDEEIDTFVAAADAQGWHSVGDAVIYGVYWGQRQGDLLAMLEIQFQPDAFGTRRLRLRQSKRKAWIDIPAHPRVLARWEAQQARRTADGVKAPTILWQDTVKRPWKADNFRHVFGELRAAAAETVPSIATAQYMDTRDTAVTKLAEAGCTIPQICAITGHDEDDAYKILRHYMAITGEMADAALAKLLAHEEQKRAAGGTNS
ncbi:hypothetical protein [Arenibaculum sp.]|jgi:hypothetical protein|uniref:tyrosine-type recombinase/integrase n=1 Tax=Arenibaculum sp. TaxID=2865862 RepID=UPI002E0F5897|nr:hypothetical protein [Arenibaculum sp.]